MSKKKLLSIAVAPLLALGGSLVLPTSASAAAATVVTDRIAGPDRYGTAVAIATKELERVTVNAGASGTVYIASGEVEWDALAAGPLANQADGDVLLLVKRNEIPADVATFLNTHVKTAGAELANNDIVILGGAGSVSDSVLAALTTYTTGSVTRIWGADRYATAAKIAEASTFTPGKYYIASGEVAWDALSAGPLAVDADAPILLTQAGALPAATSAFLKAEEAAGSITALPIIGGKGSVGTAVVNALSAIEGVMLSTATIESTRIAGANRYSTSAAVAAALSAANADVKYSQFYVASGTVYADALSGVQLAGDAAPIMLVGAAVDIAVQAQLSLPSATTGTVRITALGGTGSVSDATLAVAAAAARNAAPVITLTTASPWYTEVGSQFNLLANVTASDATDGNLTSKVVVAKVQKDNASGADVAFSTAAAGVFYVTFEVKDSGGLADTENATVNVVEPATISLAPGIDNTWTAAQALTSSLLEDVTLTTQNAADTVANTALAAVNAGTALLPGFDVDVTQIGGLSITDPITLSILNNKVLLGLGVAGDTFKVTYSWVENGITVSVDRIITITLAG